MKKRYFFIFFLVLAVFFIINTSSINTKMYKILDSEGNIVRIVSNPVLSIKEKEAGYTRADDKLPKRFYEAQPSTGYVIDKDMMTKTIDEYYKIYGYGKYGPDKKRAELLDISEVM